MGLTFSCLHTPSVPDRASNADCLVHELFLSLELNLFLAGELAFDDDMLLDRISQNFMTRMSQVDAAELVNLVSLIDICCITADHWHVCQPMP